MSIDLQQFCAGEYDPRQDIRAPFRHDGYIYATNAHLMVRIPDDGREAPDKPDRIDFAKVWPAEWPTAWHRIIGPIPQSEEEECGECDGKGVVECSYSYEHPCPDCDESGKIKIRHMIVVNLLGGGARAHYVEQLNALPGCTWSTTKLPGHNADPALPLFCLQGDGWSGLLMPCHMSVEDKGRVITTEPA